MPCERGEKLLFLFGREYPITGLNQVDDLKVGVDVIRALIDGTNVRRNRVFLLSHRHKGLVTDRIFVHT